MAIVEHEPITGFSGRGAPSGVQVLLVRGLGLDQSPLKVKAF